MDHPKVKPPDFEWNFGRGVRVLVWSEKYIETRFPNGLGGEAICPAVFTETDENRTLAEELGYGDKVWQMHLEHELLHTILSNGWSRTLAHVAGVVNASDEERQDEEGRVLDAQKALNQLRPLVEAFAIWYCKDMEVEGY